MKQSNNINDSMTVNAEPATSQKYDSQRLSYANTFKNPLQRRIIQGLELLTGKYTLLQCVRQFENQGIPHGQPFWAQALSILGIELGTPDDELENIPPTGPLVVTANHPQGLIDGMILAELIGRVRTDYKILTRSLLTGVDQIDQFMIPVPFPHEEDALERNLEMRKATMEHLNHGGCIAVFPSGAVASSTTFSGPIVEKTWNPFTAKMIHRSKAHVVPINFTDGNSRLYQVANQISATLRQGLLIREVVNAMNKPQSPIIGNALSPKEIETHTHNPREFMEWLRQKTINLTRS